jgi:hypothetical protein
MKKVEKLLEELETELMKKGSGASYGPIYHRTKGKSGIAITILTNEENQEPEKEAIDHKCPDCGGGLNALIGVFGREVCRVCKQTVITNRNDDKFDDHEWAYLGDVCDNNARYGRVDRSIKTVDPRSIGSKTEHDIIETTMDAGGIRHRGLINEEKKEKARKKYSCIICGRGPCNSEVPGSFVDPERCLYMPGQEPVWVPDWIKPGMKCNYHSIIGGEVTIPDCTIESEIYLTGDTPTVMLDKIRGCVSALSLSRCE